MGLTIQIKAGRDVGSSSILASGSVQHVITDKERSSFGLTDDALKNAVAKYFGKRPNDAYVKSPTPWDDLYKTYGWPQVQTILNVSKAQILEITSNPAILKTTKLKNDSTKTGYFTANVNDSVTNTTDTNWNLTTTVDVSETVQYSVELEGIASVGGSTTWSFSESFGVGGSESKSITVGSDQGVSVELGPGESADVQLTVSTGQLKARVFYDVYLIGTTAINYNPTYKGHHFWALDIGAVTQAGDIQNHRSITEDIKVGYYSNAEVKLSDAGKFAFKALAARSEAA